MSSFDCGRFRLALTRTLVMGVVNITPDSFSDGEVGTTPASAVELARRLIEEGADMIDLGAESTRPGATPLSQADELKRLLPVLSALRDVAVPISVDTYKPEVMSIALAEGASMINDIYAFRLPGSIEAVAGSDCGLCVMHMQHDPLTMQAAPHYKDVVGEVRDFLTDRLAVLAAAGVGQNRICIDPGFGFGKNVMQNYQLLHGLDQLATCGVPLLAGLSRKSMIGAVTGRPVGDRLAGSVAAALAAAARGAAIVRVHDVAATVDALKVWRAVAAPETELECA